MEFSTAQIHGAAPSDSNRSITVPIYTSTAYSFESEQQIENLMAGKEKGYFYNRVGSPTTAAFEARCAELEGGVTAVASASGTSACIMIVLALGKAGDNFVVSTKLFGGVHQMWKVFLPRLGITAKFVSSADPADFEAAIDENTKGIFIESIANPSLEVLDIPELSKVAHNHGIPLIVDNTVGGGGYLIKPIELGADVVVHSATKWMSGHGASLGGVVVDGGKFPFAGNPRFPEFNEELPGFPGTILGEKGPLALSIKMRVQTLRDSGATINPHGSYALLQGLETLSLRMDRHVANALALAKFLEQRPEVAYVLYPGLPSHPSYAVAQRLLPRGAGGIVSFGLKPVGEKTGLQLARNVIDATKLCTHAANLGDVRTLIIHPATSTQRQLSDDEQVRNGTPKDLVRVSVGIEDIKDIIKDFEQAIEAVVAAAKA
ncbi:hypothetical protein MNV49_003350 [Pseudohyphozyma bogoriensis]|nr:hypothetical protein MNV49_003350 [Pseudohyphozyma bogoriensis]